MAASRLKTSDIPQAENLLEIRELVSALTEVGTETEALAEHTGFSDRHVCYRLHAAKVLGLVDGARRITALGSRLLGSPPGSQDERTALCLAVGNCRAVRRVVPDLLESAEFDQNAVAEKLKELAGLSASTAQRRAHILAAWREQLRVEEPSQSPES
jgi:hypothetical protein